jgi:hypothetical protein
MVFASMVLYHCGGFGGNKPMLGMKRTKASRGWSFRVGVEGA